MTGQYSHRRFSIYTIFTGLCLLGGVGCTGGSGEPPRLPVAGLVLVDGRPLPSGTILFYPSARAIVSAPMVSGDEIRNGRFSLSRDKGLAIGKYRIAVSSEEKDLDPRAASIALSTPKEKIPVRFNSQTELEVEVKDGGIKELRIAIASK